MYAKVLLTIHFARIVDWTARDGLYDDPYHPIGKYSEYYPL